MTDESDMVNETDRPNGLDRTSGPEMESTGGLIAIPAEQLSAAALQGVIEEFITREGTDYGAVEIELAAKVEQVHRQLRKGEALIVFDAAAETCTIMTREQLTQMESQASR